MYEPIEVREPNGDKPLTPSEAEDYFAWYTEQAEKRLLMFVGHVKSFVGYEEWNDDFSPESLKVLGRWLAENVEAEKAPRKELLAWYRAAPRIQRKTYPTLDAWIKGMRIPDWDLTLRTYSYCFDIGAYVTQVYLNAFPMLRWEMNPDEPNRDFLGYQPVVAGFQGRSIQPFQATVAVAMDIVEGKQLGEALYRQFSTLSERAPAG